MNASSRVPPAFAQAQRPQILNPVLSSSLEADGLHLQVRFELGGGFGDEWWQPTAGADLYRRTVGVRCGAWERLSAEPIVWNWDESVELGEAHLEFEIVDASTAPGSAYEYQVRAVDPERKPVEENQHVTVGFATHGEALLGHGTLYGGPDCGISYTQQTYPCQGECFPFLIAGATGDVAQYFNTGTTVLLYGRVTGVLHSFCNSIVPVATFSSARPSQCVVSVRESTWSAAKRLYR
jgi:hypothetical protein